MSTLRLVFLLGLIATPASSQVIVLSACGTVDYTKAIGTLHPLTMNTAGYLCVTTSSTTQQQQQEEPSATQQEEPKQ